MANPEEMREIYIKMLKESRGVPDEIARSPDITAASRYLGYNRIAVRDFLNPEYNSEGEVERMIAELNTKTPI